ncbi:MAG: hypothetical protein IT456_11375 [Planctomycetes bacterium]|nr:hypothetical protein [Planctomycetota bacterium]
MRNAYSLSVLSGLLALTFAACSGGGGTDSTSSVRIPCAGGEAFCLISCDLGCSQTGCSITEIAENQRLRFTFSDRLAQDSVSNSSVSIRTLTGVAPDGDLVVSNNVLTFVPSVRTINGVSSFGFQRNETYIITLSGGASSPFSIRNTGGGRLTKEFSCTVVASRGIADDDQQPPSASLVAPTNTNAAPLDPTIVLRFSELIDTTPLRGALTPSSPLRYTLRRAISGANGLTCDRDSAGTVLLGIPRLSTEHVGDHDVTVVTFKPTVQLPGESCVEVVVTADLRDLSGRQATPAAFEFFTQAGVSTPLTFSEAFGSPANLDELVSGGTWNGGARPALIGGDGRHGSFDPSTGSGGQSSEYTWNLDQVIIPSSQSLTGLEYTITDGKFYFTDFTLPAGITLNFVGSVPPQIYVRGKATVAGTIRLNGVAMTTFNGRGGSSSPAPFIEGQVGSIGGAGGGRGGKGGKECAGGGAESQVINGVLTFLNNGQNGDDVKLLAGHAYAVNAGGTGGRGGTLHPSNGLVPPANTATALSGIYNPFFAAGGSGGGMSLAGSQATVSPFNLLQVNTIPSPGAQFNLFPYPPVSAPAGYSSLNHFVVGGSGGGGGASHAFGTFNIAGTTFDRFVAGAGGSGGGGALALRAGSDLSIAGTASLQAKGGAGVLIRGNDSTATTNVNWGVTSPGGGGSGGSFLLQSGANLQMLGTIDTSGGNGSSTGQIFTAQFNVASQAGAGSPGFYRLEAPSSITVGSATNVPAYSAAVNSGVLTDSDPFSGCTSLWRSSNLIFPPEWVSYELDVDTDGNGTVDVTFTDSGAVGSQVANDINGPVVIQFQGAVIDQATGLPTDGVTGPWRYGVGAGAVPGIGLDSATGFRFMMTFNRGGFPDCVVKALRVNART